MNESKDSVDEVINSMDSYFLTQKDEDALFELGLGSIGALQQLSISCQNGYLRHLPAVSNLLGQRHTKGLYLF